MKKILFGICFLIYNSGSFGQIMQASIGTGSAPTNIIIYIRPTSGVNGNISTIQFSVSIDPSISPIPTLSFVGSPSFGSGWQIDPPYVEGGQRLYDITNTAAGTLVLAANTELAIMELQFSGGPVAANNVSLYTLPGGGVTTGNGLFFCSGAANSAEGQLYYVRSGVTVLNNTSYSGVLPSFATIGGILLPVVYTSFLTSCSDNGAILKWSTASEQNSSYFEIQKSTDGTNWVTLGKTTAAGLSTTTRNYQYNDLGGGTGFYRIREVDVDGKPTYSEIRRSACESRTFNVSLYPVPASDKITLAIYSDKAFKDNLQVFDAAGKVVKQISANISSGNSTLVINVSDLSQGQYILRGSGATFNLTKKFIIER